MSDKIEAATVAIIKVINGTMLGWNPRDAARAALEAAGLEPSPPQEQDTEDRKGSLLERVAKAIFATAVGSGQWDNEFWRDEREGCLRSARAAIEAMRDPTQEVLSASLTRHFDGTP